MDRNKPLASLTSPKGTAVYPNLNKPSIKFDNDGVYEIKLRIKKEDCGAFIKEIEGLYEANYKAKCEEKGSKRKRADLPFKDVLDKDTDKPTGEVEFKFKMKASGTRQDGNRWEQRPKIFDGAGNPMPKPGHKLPNIGSGTTCKVAFEVRGWDAPIGVGISLKLKAVQIIDLIEFGGSADASSFGFSSEGEAIETVSSEPAVAVKETTEETTSESYEF